MSSSNSTSSGEGDSSTLDLVSGLVFLVLVVGYHGWLFSYTERHPHATVNGIASAARTAWITGMLKKPDNILAAQLLRNWVLTAQLLGTTSISVMFGMLGFAGTFRGFKIAILLLVYLMSFLCFAQVSRLFGHTLITYTATNYALKPPTAQVLSSASAATSPLPEYPVPHELAPDLLSHLLNSGAFYWTIGTRLFSFSFAILLWFFGAIPMLVTGVATVGMLVVLDLAGLTARFERWVSGEDEEVLEGEDDDVELASVGDLHEDASKLNVPAARPGVSPGSDRSKTMPPGATASDLVKSASHAASKTGSAPFVHLVAAAKDGEEDPYVSGGPQWLGSLLHAAKNACMLGLNPCSVHDFRSQPASSAPPSDSLANTEAVGSSSLTPPTVQSSPARLRAAATMTRRTSMGVIFQGQGYFAEPAGGAFDAGARRESSASADTKLMGSGSMGV
ncbi:hypothetical protein HDU93_009091 [Gonapodya sp. JEL0774]|nr:hypothetical protein HDU93_009091 [Gonapodya sp. JEL0774]